MASPDPVDPTPEFGSPTDMAPLGRSGEKPEHEKTAAEDRDVANWDAIANDPDFHALIKAKNRFIIPGTIFFLVYYMTLPVLVGFFPDVMKQRVWGAINWAYLFALSQFIMTGVLCVLYVRAAKRWDVMNAALLAKFNHR